MQAQRKIGILVAACATVLVVWIGSASAQQANVRIETQGPTRGEPSLRVTFRAFGSPETAPGCEQLAYQWDFGEGVGQRGNEVVHAYSKPGLYTAKVTYVQHRSDPDAPCVPVPQFSAENTVTIEVLKIPEACFTMRPESPVEARQEVSFDATCTRVSRDPDTHIMTYDWDFGDGTTNTDRQATHAYSRPGTYNVTLVVRDRTLGTEDRIEQSLVVRTTNRPPTACFDILSDRPAPGDTVMFDASCSVDPDGQIHGYNWDFGDGQSSAGRRVAHAYGQADTVTVALSVVDDGGLVSARQTKTLVIRGVVSRRWIYVLAAAAAIAALAGALAKQLKKRTAKRTADSLEVRLKSDPGRAWVEADRPLLGLDLEIVVQPGTSRHFVEIDGHLIARIEVGHG